MTPMSDNEIRLAIATACNIQQACIRCETLHGLRETECPSCGAAVLGMRRFPDYPNDLNACHEFEKTLEIGNDGSEEADYQETLYSIVNPGRHFIEDFCEGADVAYLHKLITATARQRCEAFCKVKGIL